MLQMDRECSFVLDMRVQAAKQALKAGSKQLQASQDGQAKDARKPGAPQALHAVKSFKLLETAAAHAEGSGICRAAAGFHGLHCMACPDEGAPAADMHPTASLPSQVPLLCVHTQ